MSKPLWSRPALPLRCVREKLALLLRRWVAALPFISKAICFGLRGEVNAPLNLPPNATDDDVKEVVWEQMKSCFDPEIPVNIVELGLIYSCELVPTTDGKRIATITMTLTAPGCGMGEVLVQDVREKVEMVPTIERADVELVFDPPWNQSMMSEAARLQTGML
jgi:probable FeS assembly SUF system protein SufT